ncbi:DUF2087 domain-containing protein [Sporosarcina sp. ANT_H38]|uniref:DUF2087 domain-containing protein n=1 Tax=Sporosarcina sp. ANT_H38 TaxID=2597358 RepID=UPI0021077422|nr:DUF2087 domain-containing protein [Sporosarcina sp. ANT_H38]
MSLDYPLEVMEKGYSEESRHYRCLVCGEEVEKGVIYPVGDVLFADWRYMEHHIERTHGSVFELLLSGGKEQTGLSDQQSKLLSLIYAGKSDKEIQQELKIGSMSTIRNHRFSLRKKEKQAKNLLALMNLVKRQQELVIDVPSIDKPIEKSFEPSKELASYFSEEDGRLKTFRLKEQEKNQLLAEIALLFKPKKVYSEGEVNAVLVTIFEDYMLLRREMIDRGVLTRNAEGSAYGLVQNGDVDEMDFKKEMKMKAKAEKPSYGIFQIKNEKNGKIFIGSTPNFKTLNGLKFMLTTGGHKNKELQSDWDEHGKESFEIELLETIDEKDWKGTSKGEILEKQLEKWLEELQPYGEKGYNRIKKL